MLEYGRHEAAEVATDDDAWGLHWALLSGKQEVTPKAALDRHSTPADDSAAQQGERATSGDETSSPDGGGGGASAAGGGAAPVPSKPQAVEGGTPPAGDGSSPPARGGASSPEVVAAGPSSGGGGPPADAGGGAGGRKATGGDTAATPAGGKGSSPEGGSASSSDGGATPVRGSMLSFDGSATSADGSANSCESGSKSDKASAKLSRQHSLSTGTQVSTEVTDNEECDSSDADSGATRSTRTSLEDILGAPENCEGFVYERHQLLRLRPGGAPSEATRPPAAPPDPPPGSGPPRVAARPPAPKQALAPLAPPAPKPERIGGSSVPAGFFVNIAALDENTAHIAASILQAELVLEALLSEDPPTSGSTGSSQLATSTPHGGRQQLTTLMLRNIPNRCTRPVLQKQLDTMGFKGEYDLVYVPMDRFNKTNSLGYAFINFKNAVSSSRFASRFHGTPAKELFPDSSSGKSLAVCYAEVQGREAYERNYVTPPRLGCPFEDLERMMTRPRFFFPCDGWSTREAWSPWPWAMHATQRMLPIADMDALCSQTCAWQPPAFRALPQRPSNGGAGGRKSLTLVAEAPEFVPTRTSPDVMSCAQAYDMTPAVHPFSYAEPVAGLRFAGHTDLSAGMMGAAAGWAMQGDMTGCGGWDTMDGSMAVGPGACYEGHDMGMMYPSWHYSEYGVPAM